MSGINAVKSKKLSAVAPITFALVVNCVVAPVSKSTSVNVLTNLPV
jgi:hypothetical protein